MTIARAGFHLSKWYGDAVSADGKVFIAYGAELRWPPLSLSYQSTLLHNNAGPSKVRTSIRGTHNPILQESGSLLWNNARLGFSGTWVPRVSAISVILLASEEGQVVWSCHVPAAAVSVHAGVMEIIGAGYAEHLSMSIPPWRLPIHELRWGRFISGDQSIVWIDWTGELPKRIGFRNGVPAPLAVVNDGELQFEDGTRLVLDQKCTLRSGELGSTALRSVSGLDRFAPARMLAIHESKWRSWGSLSSNGVSDSGGWAIHEVVRWP